MALVDPFLQVVDAPGVFVVGDAASVTQNGGAGGDSERADVGRLIAKELKGQKAAHSFSYFDKGNMAAVGKKIRGTRKGPTAHERYWSHRPLLLAFGRLSVPGAWHHRKRISNSCADPDSIVFAWKRPRLASRPPLQIAQSAP